MGSEMCIRDSDHSTPIEPAGTWDSPACALSLTTPGHTTLFKATSLPRISRFPKTSPNDLLSILRFLLTYPPSDFSSTRSLLYLTPDPSLAASPSVTLSLRIPDSALANLAPGKIWRLY